MISHWLFFPQHPAALKIFFLCTSSAPSSWGSCFKTTISQHGPLARIISGRYYASDVLCESGLLDSRSLLAGAKTNLTSVTWSTTPAPQKKPTHFRVKYRWRGTNDRFVYLWNEQSSRPFSDRGHFSLHLWESSHIHTNPPAISLSQPVVVFISSLSMRLMRLLFHFNCISWITFPRQNTVIETDNAHTHTC